MTGAICSARTVASTLYFGAGAPRVNELGRAAIMASDLVLIPVQPSPYDVWASTEGGKGATPL
jgi:hypothetical protein